VTDRRTPVEPAAALADVPGVALKVRVPVLRRPPGWGVLDEPALRVRATQLYLACMQQVHPLERVRDKGGCTSPGLPASWQEAVVPAFQEAPAPGPGPGLAAPMRFTAPMISMPSAPALATPAAAPAELHAAPALRKGSHWHLLPWGLLLGGAMIMTPWLIWAPLVGGLCMGLLLLQTGMLRHWLQARTLLQEAAAGTSDRRASGFAQTRGMVEVAGIEAVQAVGPRRLRFAHGGWMLTAALALVGVQAATLFATVQIKNREPAILAEAIRAAHPGREAPPGTPPGTPPDARQLLQPLQGRGAAPAAGRPDGETAEPAGPQRGAAP